MKYSTAATALLISAAAAAPTIDYTPPGGWESIKYPDGTGENLHEYPAPPGGWENVKYPPGTGENLPYYPPTGEAPKDCPAPPASPFKFTSTYHVVATPDQVVNGTTPTGGLEGAQGFYDLGINSDLDLICWSIKLTGFRGDYSSPADTATHIHEAAFGASGPPRIAFPNPVGNEQEAVSYGCQVGPFVTGLEGPDGNDTGLGFKVAEIEANPAGFFADVHSSLAVPGAVRGQLA
ncbi:hypothetical protein FH972_024196 [Carpinus fangiana]|uniref:CHRD domain-containing protein n=1 Tax=Carpinus fangiana TaxID=176857 RepID=A0A5N6KY16_9ROSI|nr:hypothetical protein FH972_024196 [Carpinus fangiana]